MCSIIILLFFLAPIHPLDMIPLLFDNVLAFWPNKISQAHLVYFLPQIWD